VPPELFFCAAAAPNGAGAPESHGLIRTMSVGLTLVGEFYSRDSTKYSWDQKGQTKLTRVSALPVTRTEQG